MAEIKIPESVLKQFENDLDQSQNSDLGATDKMAVKSLEESLSWICNMADGYMKDQGLTGFGEMGADDYSKITALLARKHFPKIIADNSIETVWGLATLGLVGVNYLDVVNKNKKASESESPGDDGQSD